jgi:hypothetical protein
MGISVRDGRRFLGRFGRAMERVVSLGGALVVVEADEDLEQVLADVWRATVVLLHASFEDAMREIVRQALYREPTKIVDLRAGRRADIDKNGRIRIGLQELAAAPDMSFKSYLGFA